MDSNKKTILVVDDEPDFQTYLSTLLEDNGYQVVIADDGEDGLAKVKEARPDLITLDVTMPVKSGVRFYREMKESDQWKSIPIIMITGVSGDFEKFISTRSQVPPPDGYISKPIQQDELLAKVKELLTTK